MSRRCWVALILSAWVAVAPSACASHPPVNSQPDRNCITDFRQGVDYFPDKSTIVDATNFTLSYHDSYQVLTVKQPYPHGRPESYVLVRCGTPAPTLTGNLAGAQRITIPITSMYSASITQLGMGIDVRRARLVTIASASLLTGATTAFCGPIAFLGLAVPHLARLAVGTSDHRMVLPTVVLMGSAVALVCGIVSQVPGSDAVLPINAVTALVGAPIVVVVLLRSRHGVGMQR
jgi:hypothetical protein